MAKFHRDDRGSQARIRTYKHWQTRQDEQSFRCVHCKTMIGIAPDIGTHHRNHCPLCLHSRHVDTRPGNRASACRGKMAPIGLTFARTRPDKYGSGHRHGTSGDLMIVHQCLSCGTLNINRIAGDDSCDEILAVLERSLSLPDAVRQECGRQGIVLLTGGDLPAVRVCLFGKGIGKTINGT